MKHVPTLEKSWPKKDTGKIKELLERSTARRRSVVADWSD